VVGDAECAGVVFEHLRNVVAARIRGSLAPLADEGNSNEHREKAGLVYIFFERTAFLARERDHSIVATVVAAKPEETVLGQAATEVALERALNVCGERTRVVICCVLNERGEVLAHECVKHRLLGDGVSGGPAASRTRRRAFAKCMPASIGHATTRKLD